MNRELSFWDGFRFGCGFITAMLAIQLVFSLVMFIIIVIFGSSVLAGLVAGIGSQIQTVPLPTFAPFPTFPAIPELTPTPFYIPIVP